MESQDAKATKTKSIFTAISNGAYKDYDLSPEHEKQSSIPKPGYAHALSCKVNRQPEEAKVESMEKTYYLDSKDNLEHQAIMKRGYYFNRSGYIRSVKADGPYQFTTQKDYDSFSTSIIKFVQSLMVNDLGMKRLGVPFPIDNKGVEGPVNIFISPDFDINMEKCLLIIQGTGNVRAGIWGRNSCINGSLELGSVIPYLRKAKEQGLSAIVLNPNIHFDSAKRPIKFHKDMANHCFYVWDTVISLCPAKQLYIAAHSAGVHCTYKLIKRNGKSLMSRVKAIACIDGTMKPGKAKEERNYIKEVAMQFEASQKTLGEPIAMDNGLNGVAAGHVKHDFAPGTAIEIIFEYFSIMAAT